MAVLTIRDFIPPIFGRSAAFLRKRLAATHSPPLHPFGALPGKINVQWVLDVGANRGDVTLAALRSFPNAKVICFEPVLHTFAKLERATAPFSDRVHLYRAALSDKRGTAEINLTTFDGANSLAVQSETHRSLNPHVQGVGTELISLVTLDDSAVNFPTQHIDIMKIDVEGHELKVLQGGKEFISNCVNIIIIEISMMRDEDARSQAVFPIFKQMDELGFSLINVFDLHSAAGEQIPLLQMDCVFQKRDRLPL